MALGTVGLLGQLLFDRDLIGLAIALVGVILVGVVAISWSKRRLQNPLSEPTPRDELEAYRKLAHQGLLQPEEFEKIRARLKARREKSE